MCKDGHKGIAWFLVLFPFVMFFLILLLTMTSQKKNKKDEKNEKEGLDIRRRKR
jgi:preprotein translocase subunit YajC